MAVPTPRTLKDYFLSCFSPSIATSPVATQVVVPFSGRIVKTYGVSLGTTTGTTAVAVAINGGSAISSAALSIGAGGAGVEVEATVNATGTDATASQVYDELHAERRYWLKSAARSQPLFGAELPNGKWKRIDTQRAESPVAHA